MGTSQWSSLPGDILSILSKILNTDVDIIRIRSVCSPWRSSLTPRRKPFSFPLKLPPIPEPSPNPSFRQFITNGDYFLTELTFYRLSNCTDGDSSKGWLFKVSAETKPNTFTLLNPLRPQKMDSSIKHLNILDYQVSEIRKSCIVQFIDEHGRRNFRPTKFKKVIALWNYFTDCEFAVLALLHDGKLLTWKFGDEDWTYVFKGFRVVDVILYNKKCYAIYGLGLLVSHDSDFNPTFVVASPVLEFFLVRNVYLVECRSNLYVVTVTESVYDPDEFEDANFEIVSTLRVRILDEGTGKWDSVTELLNVAFILSHEASLSISAEDFQGFKTNRIYVNGKCFALQLQGSGPFTSMVGVYVDSQEFAEIVRPPTWLSA